MHHRPIGTARFDDFAVTRFAALPLALVLAVGGLAACGDDDAATTAAPDVTAAPTEDQAGAEEAFEDVGVDDVEYGVQIEELDEITRLDRQQITLRGEVGELFDPSAMTIVGGESAVAEPLLVLGVPEESDVTVGEPARVQGTVHASLDRSLVQEELGIELDEQTFGQFEGQPYITATQVTPVEESEG